MSKSPSQAYAERFNRVFDFIDRHLDEDLSLERLSRVAHFSRFHFHRQFSHYCGMTVSRYIQMMRLDRASHRLVFNPSDRIIDNAIAAGFENPESFSRAFKKAFGQTPTQFRRQPVRRPWSERPSTPSRSSRPMNVNIIDFAAVRVAVLEHRGAPERVNDTAMKFIEWRKTSGLSPVTRSRTFGIAYDDPETTEPAKFRLDICGEVTAEVPVNPQGVINKLIPGGRCAVVRHLGSPDRIGESAHYLYRQWLPESGEELRDFPMFFHWVNLRPDTPEHELIADIHLPLR